MNDSASNPRAPRPTKAADVTAWILQVLAAVILGQTLFFKFTGAAGARALFETLGAEPWGRIGTGVVELVAVVLLLVPGRAALGALVGLGLMVGAVGSHLTVLGIEVQGDGGTLFAMAVVTLVASAVVLWIRRAELPILGQRSAALGAESQR